MDSKLLEYFLRVIELGSINRAAADLDLSQPALSRYIGSLEHEMGTKLFSRSQGGERLTEPGKLLADRARPLLRQFTIVKEQVGELAAGQLSIGIPPSWQHVFTTTFVAQMVRQYPSVSLRIYEGVSNVLRDHMLAGLLDLCIIPFDSSPAEGYAQKPLVRDPLVLVKQVGAGLDKATPVSIAALDGVKLVLPGRTNVLRVQIEHALTRNGMKFLMAAETDTLTLCLDLARLGIGATVMPACALHGHRLGDSIEWSPIKGQYITWALFENEARSHSHAVREGRSLVLTIVAACLASGDWHGAEPAGVGISAVSRSPDFG